MTAWEWRHACDTGCVRKSVSPPGATHLCSRLRFGAAIAQGIRIALTDGAAHAVDSSEMAFKLACQSAFREAFMRAAPVILEPVMAVDVSAPSEFQGTVIGDLNRRKGLILNSESEADDVVMQAQVTWSPAPATVSKL